MRKKIVAGNWKMHKTLPEAMSLATAIADNLTNTDTGVGVVVGVPFPFIGNVSELLAGKGISVAAQNCYYEEQGAFTGEVSVSMLKSVGCTHVIVGHSERRNIFGELDEQVAKKVTALLTKKVTPIFCCGEGLEERQAGNHFEVIKTQLEKGLFHVSVEDFSSVIVAYEPVWAIGTGETATPEQAQEVHAYIRKLIKDKYTADLAENTTVLYGGSCKPSNAKELFSCADVDGGLIGGAALKAEDFVSIINALA